MSNSYTYNRSLKSDLCPGRKDFMCCTSGGDPVYDPVCSAKNTKNSKKNLRSS